MSIFFRLLFVHGFHADKCHGILLLNLYIYGFCSLLQAVRGPTAAACRDGICILVDSCLLIGYHSSTIRTFDIDTTIWNTCKYIYIAKLVA